MKRIAIVLSSAAWVLSAQAQAPQPAPAAPPDAAARPVAYKVVEPRTVTDYPAPSKVDPRVCLEFPTRAQVIACANKYLPAKRRS
jgi:hypothetical protein